MTIASQTSRISYTGNSSTTAFSVPFYFAANADLVVYLTSTSGTQTLQVLGTNYTLTGATLSAGGTCTFITAPPTGYIVAIYRDPALTQTTSYNNNDPFPAKSHELALDKALTIDQRTRDLVTRAIHLADGETTIATTLAAAATRANKLLGFDTAGALAYRDSPTFVGSTALGVADVSTRATAAGTIFPVSTTAVSTAGYYTAGDGGGGNYVAGSISGPGAFQDGSGNWWQLESGKLFNVRQFGAKGDGVANDTTAIQAAETARAAAGGLLVFPQGTYLISGITVNRATGGGWQGLGLARLIPTANAVVMADLSGAVTGSSSRAFAIEGLSFDGNAKTSVTAVREAAPYLTTLNNLTITNVQYAGLFQRGRGVTISNIKQYGSGSWALTGVGTGVNDRIFEVNISNIVHESLGGADWSSAQQWFSFYRAIGVNMTNVITSSLDGAAMGLNLIGACEGVFLSNCIFVYPTYGIKAEVGADLVYPAYIYLSNVGIDQPTVTGFDNAGFVVRLSNCNVTFGDARTNSGDGMRIRAAAYDVRIFGLYMVNMYRSGLVVETGALDVSVSNSTIKNNNQIAGAFFDVDAQATSYVDVVFQGKNDIGTISATGQRFSNSVTSKEVYRNLTPAATIANTTATTLMSYTILTNTLKAGQKVRARAWGTFAANGNTKTIEIAFGSQQIAVHLGAFNNLAWIIEGEVLSIGASSQSWNGSGFVHSVSLTSTQGTCAIPTNAGILVQMRATNGTASANDIVCNGFTLEILD